MTNINQKINQKIETLVSNVQAITTVQLENLRETFGVTFPENDVYTCNEGIIFTNVDVYTYFGDNTGLNYCKATNMKTAKNPVSIFMKREDKIVSDVLKVLNPKVKPTLTVVQDSVKVTTDQGTFTPASTSPVTLATVKVSGKRGRKATPEGMAKKEALAKERAEKKALRAAKKQAKLEAKANKVPGVRGRKADPVKQEAKAAAKAAKRAARAAKKMAKEEAKANKVPGVRGRKADPVKAAMKQAVVEAKAAAKKAKEEFMASFLASKNLSSAS
jgi:DNA-binding protein HU-beta